MSGGESELDVKNYNSVQFEINIHLIDVVFVSDLICKESNLYW